MKKRRKRRIAPIIILVLVVLIVGAASVIGYGILSAGKGSKNKTEKNTEQTAENTKKHSSDDDQNSPDDYDYSLSDSDSPYLIKVNRAANCVTVYSKDADGHYTVPIKAIVCSTAKDKESTPLGTFKTSEKYDWRLMVDGTYSQYAYRIEGEIMFHSVPCFKQDKSRLEVEEYNKLGQPASLGCIRMTVRDTKWIYDNCPPGTTVVIYDDESNPGPLGKPESIKIPEDSEYSGWDPTDPDPENPWLSCGPIISNAYDLTLKTGSSMNLLKYITAVDTCGNDITKNVGLTGNYDLSKPGIYTVTYTVTDLLGKTVSVSANITVADNVVETEPIETATAVRETSKNSKKKNDDDDDDEETYRHTQEYTTTAAPETTTQAPVETTQETVAPETTTSAPTTEAPTTETTTQQETTTEAPTTEAPTDETTRKHNNDDNNE